MFFSKIIGYLHPNELPWHVRVILDIFISRWIQ
jgi:hypothetical protein